MFNYVKRYFDYFMNNDIANRYVLFVILYNYISSKKVLNNEINKINTSIDNNDYLFGFLETNHFSQDISNNFLESNQIIDEKIIRSEGILEYTNTAKRRLISNILDISGVDEFLKNTVIDIKIDVENFKLAKIIIKPAIYDQYIQNKIDLFYSIKFTSIFVFILFVLYFFVYLYR